MKQRNLFALFVFSFVTFGIYDLFWTKVTRDEMVQKGAKIPPFSFLFLPFVIALFLLLSAFGWTLFANSNPSGANSPEVNVPISVVAIIAVVAVPIVVLWWYYKYCEGIAFITRGKTSLNFAFFLFILFNIFSVGIIWPLIMQDAFNKLGEVTPPQNPQNPQAPQSPTASGTNPIIYSR